jgi:hypothetical protein
MSTKKGWNTNKLLFNFNIERKGIEDTAVDDDFEIALEAADEDNRPNKRQKSGKNSKRAYKVPS